MSDDVIKWLVLPSVVVSTLVFITTKSALLTVIALVATPILVTVGFIAFLFYALGATLEHAEE